MYVSKVRYGVGEVYGHGFASLFPEQVRKHTAASFRDQSCPFREIGAKCNKSGGVCSLRLYEETDDGIVRPVGIKLVTTCPMRFYQDNTASSWIGHELLGCDTPLMLRELSFLKSPSTEAESARPVGKIDMVLVHPDTEHLRWCALEMQAVYFSGRSLSSELRKLQKWKGPGLPFPMHQRRPDFRSSGPKRLMPQLQIKVPTLSRWGKRIAVIIDHAFWLSLGQMPEVNDKSNCDIAWFVVDYEENKGSFSLRPHSLHLTTLDRAVEGLTGGIPTSLGNFEEALRARLHNG